MTDSELLRVLAVELQHDGNGADADACRRAADVLERLPVTADGVPVVPGMVVYKGPNEPYSADLAEDPKYIAELNEHKDDLYPVGTEIRMELCAGYEGDVGPSECYSTRAAAEAAAREGHKTEP